MSARSRIVGLVAVVDLEKRSGLRVVRLICKGRRLGALEFTLDGLISPARTASNIGLEPSAMNACFYMLRRCEAEAAYIGGVLETVVCLVLFAGLGSDAEETLLRIIPV